MGLFDVLTSNFEKAKSALQGEMAKMKSADACNASLAIVALVAGADGEVEPEERKAGAEFVRKGTLFQAFDRSKLAATLEEYYGKATNDILKEDLLDVLRKIKKDPDAARAAVKVGIGIAKADGEFEPQEKEALIEACEVMGLDPKSFKGLAA